MTVTINSKEYELHFGMKAMEIFYKLAGVMDSDSLFNAEQVTAILWGGLQNGAYRQQKGLDLTFADVSDFVEASFFSEEGQKVLADAMTAFNESQIVKSMAGMSKEVTEQAAGEVKKKKLTSPKSASSLSAV